MDRREIFDYGGMSIKEIGEAEVSDTDTISRQAAIEAVEKAVFKGVAKSSIESLPPVAPERPKGEWVHKDVVRNEDNTIEEWQEMECSVCGKWHTTPYAYYINEDNYYPNCGADMRGEE